MTGILTVELRNGERRVITSNARSKSLSIVPGALAFEANSKRLLSFGQQYIVFGKYPLPHPALLAVDPSTGDRKPITAFAYRDYLCRARSDPRHRTALVLVEDSYPEEMHIYLVDTVRGDKRVAFTVGAADGIRDLTWDVLRPLRRHVLFVDVRSRLRALDVVTKIVTVISDRNTGGGAAMIEPAALVCDPFAKRIILASANGTILGVDPATGFRTLLASPSKGGGIRLHGCYDIEMLGPDRLLVVDEKRLALVVVDLISGDRVVMSN